MAVANDSANAAAAVALVAAAAVMAALIIVIIIAVAVQLEMCAILSSSISPIHNQNIHSI